MALPPPPADRLFAVMHDGSQPLTWGDMAVKRSRIAHSLAKRLPDSIIAGAIYGKNSVEWLLCNQVCTVLGLRFSPINWHLVADEIAFIVDDCDADVVFFGKEFAPQVASMRAQTPRVKAWVCMDGAVEGAIPLEELVSEAPVDAQPPVHKRVGGMIGYTGGTSGRPKGAVRSGGTNDPRRSMAMLQDWGMLRMMPTPVQLVAAPLYHAMPGAWYGIGQALGTTFVLMPKFDAAATLAAIDRFKVNGLYMPPILLKRLLQVPDDVRRRHDRSTVRTVMSSGAACPSVVKQGITDLFGPVLHEVYGASELGGVTVMDPENMLKKPLSCGKPVQGIEVIILDDKRNRIQESRVAGEIFAKGFNIDGYHKQEKKTEEAKFGDYFSVGDVGYFDEDGFLYISDRKIDMVVSGGVNIYPAQVEEVLQAHPDLEDVAVFGVPDEEFGERVHAAVKPHVGRRVTAESVLQFCEGKIGKFQLPRAADITFHSEDFPRSEAGKLRKKALREQVLAAPRSRL
mmetsp:Transcript_11095/g.25228  ORF Transcript_11095/g.25228 Transcript_11095/m.25228 type:complete len:512 (-) Transcript_11095:83-1618(-)